MTENAENKVDHGANDQDFRDSAYIGMQLSPQSGDRKGVIFIISKPKVSGCFLGI